MKLDGRVAIITGSGQGIGREIALTLAGEGASVVLADLNPETINGVAGEIRAMGCKVLPVPTDVSSETQVNSLVAKTLATFGKIDVLANVAGGSFKSRGQTLWEVNLQDFQKVLNVNLVGMFLTCRAVSPVMIKRHIGSIINVSSNHGKHGVARNGSYCSAKFGVEGFTQTLALELEGTGVRANVLRPGGSTASPTILKRGDNDYSLLARVEIVRPLTLYLASDDSAGVTGQSIDCREWNPVHGFGALKDYLYAPPAQAA